MKKSIPLIPVMFMFAILIGLFFFVCLPQNQSNLTAQEGLLDLRSVSLDETAVPLAGQWRFVYGEILTPDAFSDAEAQAGTIAVPSSWRDSGYPLKGCATYKLTVLTDSNSLMLYLPEISSSYNLWLNGEIVRSAGVVSADPNMGKLLIENALIPTQAKNGRLEIVIQISNNRFTYSGINDTILLGESGTVLSWFFRTRAFHSVALGCILMAAFYHLTLYIFRRREKVYMLFSLLCFSCFVKFLMETNGLNEYFQWIPMDMFGIRLYFVVFYLHASLVTIFTIYVFNPAFLYRYRYAFAVYFAIKLMMNLFIPITFEYFILLTTVTTLPALILDIIIAARSPVLKEDRMTWLYFAALLLFIVVGLTSKVFLDILFMTGLISNLFVIMSQSLVLSNRYTNAFALVEETNQNLEALVAERTRQLAQTNETLLISQNALKEMIGNISHDLKTPLTVLGQYLELLDDGSIDLEAHERSDYIHVAYNKNLNMQRLIRNLFEATRIETGQTVYKLEWQSLSKLLFDMEDRHGRYLRELGLCFAINGGVDCRIKIDRDKIWSVFDNIIYNAARHTPKGNTITVAARYGGGACTVSITDTGEGIAGEHLPYIFDRFYKVSKARSESGGDSGIGLYIAKTAVQGMNGSITVQSRVDEGTSFSITLEAENSL